MRTLMISLVFALGALSLGIVRAASAEEEQTMSVNQVLQQIRASQSVASNDQIDCAKVTGQQFEALGDAVMGVMHPQEQAHEYMDQMMGGEGSYSLQAMHKMMGARYLGCYVGGMMGNGYGTGMPMMGGATMMGGGYNYLGGHMYGNPWNMMGYGYGWHNVMAISMWIILAVGLIALVILLVRAAAAPGRKEEESAEEILKKRYAKGEISKEDFERMKKDIVS